MRKGEMMQWFESGHFGECQLWVERCHWSEQQKLLAIDGNDPPLNLNAPA